MTGITDEKHLVEGALALCAAVRAAGRDREAWAAKLDEAEAHFNAVRTKGSRKPKDKESDDGE